MIRVWRTGDPEPDDHPDVVGEDPYDGTCHWRWEPPSGDHPDWGAWWCVEGAGDLYEWDEVLSHCAGILTETKDIEFE